MIELLKFAASYQGHVSAALVLGGVDVTGPHLHTVSILLLVNLRLLLIFFIYAKCRDAFQPVSYSQSIQSHFLTKIFESRCKDGAEGFSVVAHG